MTERIDAAMAHGYGWKESSEVEQQELLLAKERSPQHEITIYDTSLPSEIGKLGVEAVVTLKADNFVEAGDSFWNHELTSAQTYVHAIKSMLPAASVINAGGARTTSTEVRKLVKEARKHGWKNIATVAVGPHYERAALVADKVANKRSNKRRNITIQVYDAKELLTNPQTHGGGAEGRIIAEEYRKRFAEVEVSEPFKELEQHEKRAMKIEKWHLTRLADLASYVIRPKVMSE